LTWAYNGGWLNQQSSQNQGLKSRNPLRVAQLRQNVSMFSVGLVAQFAQNLPENALSLGGSLSSERWLNMFRIGGSL